MSSSLKEMLKKVVALGCTVAMVMTSSAFATSAAVIKEDSVDEKIKNVSTEEVIDETSEDTAASEFAETAKPVIWIVGDSTVCNYIKPDGSYTDATYLYPRYGYGTQLANYLDGSYEINNIAASGTSSLSFMTAKADDYNKFKSQVKSGDYLIIGFGHNDEKFEAARYTNPNTDVNTAGSFQKVLYDNYVKVASDKGATPILCTPIVRYSDGAYTGDKVHNTSASGSATAAMPGGDYAKSIKDLAAAKSVACVDLTEITKNIWEPLGEEAKYFLAWTTPTSTMDGTHVNIYGAKVIAYQLAKSIKEQSIGDLASHVDLSAGEPTKEKDLVKNEIYRPVEYTRPEEYAKTELADYYVAEAEGKSVKFSPTIFGDVGSSAADINANNFSMTKTTDGKMNIKASTGSISDLGDGLAMYYYRIPVSSNFIFKANATVNRLATVDNLSGFGLMARDDIYVDEFSKSINSDYVVAGMGSANGAPFGTNCFKRQGGTVDNSLMLTKEAMDCNTYALSISKNSDGYACEIEGEEARSAGYDFPLNFVDSEYQYIGMFAAKGMDITFGDIYLEVDGKVLVDQTKKAKNTVTVNVSDAKAGSARASFTKAAEGDIVTLVNTENDGYKFVEYSSEDVTITDGKFTMPNKAVTITAKFEVNNTNYNKTDIWDFGGYVDPKTSDKDKYNNYITPTTLVASGMLDKNIFTAKTGVFGDLEWTTIAKDRFYTSVADLSANDYGWQTKWAIAYPDGYTGAGCWYSNGTRLNKENVVINNCKAGDKLVFYAGSNNNQDTTYAVKQLTGKNADTVTELGTSAGFEMYNYICKEDGNYVIYQSAGTGKPLEYRVMRVHGAVVSGTIDFGSAEVPAGVGMYFTNKKTEDVTTAVVTKDGSEYKYTVTLTPGYEYLASLSGMPGYGITSATKNYTVANEDSFEGISGRNVNVTEQKTFKLTGNITGFTEDANNVFTNLVIKFIPDPLAGLETVKAKMTKSGSTISYIAEGLSPDNDYEVAIEGANDFSVASPKKINKASDSVENITLTKVAVYDVTGSFTGAETVDVTSLAFKNVDDNYTYTATVEGNGYTVKLRDGSYAAVATVKDNKYKTSSHVVVNGGKVTKDLYFVETNPVVEPAKANDIYVGYDKKENNYNTVKAAVAAAKAKGATADSRITIHIAPGTYREQIKVDTPYISFVNDEYANGKEVLLTWYYGIDYKYYSVGADGFYNEERLVDQYEKTTVTQKWGTCVLVTKDATEFRAEGITFENSFNRYITDEELEDGVKLDGGQGNVKIERTYATDVCSKAATERAAALCTEAPRSEYKNCKFLGSQDTLYTAADAYFKNCFIEGQTDYVFGSGNVVFDSCELSFKGYTAGSLGGYITANKPAVATEAGYMFRNCAITGNDDAGVTVTPGYYGRPWGADAKVLFANSKLENNKLIVSDGWTAMNSNTPGNANFYERNTKLMTGTEVANAKYSKPVTDEMVKVSKYFGTWKPVYYTEEKDSIGFTSDPQITSNGDLNLPYPGNTLTVKYELNDKNSDASVIIWYADDAVVKCATAATGKTYKIRKEDTGKIIKVVVKPEFISGLTGVEKSYTLAEKVQDGYEDPSDPASSELGEGVNVFLAGDSTVKDYSAKGMHQGGKISAEGSWGEYLQTFFDEKLVKIVDYANGGRSSRTFLNDHVTSSDKTSQRMYDRMISEMKKGDYLLIQFGHNDCGGPSYADRYVKIGTPDKNGIYPLIEGTTDTYGDYPQDNPGTYKWFLKKYVDDARSKGAIPILVTPVARMYYNTDGTIKPHHMVAGEENDCYVKAVRQLAKEENVILIDAYEATKAMFEEAWKANNDDKTGFQAMANTSEKTHNNKVGGMIEAMLMASEIQKIDCTLQKAVNGPAKVAGVDVNGISQFIIDKDGKFDAKNSYTSYKETSEFWTTYGQNMIDAIKAKHDKLNGTNPGKDDKPAGDGSGFVAEFTSTPECVYTGSAITPAVTVKFNGVEIAEGADYTLVYKNNVNAYESEEVTAKTPRVIVTGKGNYAGKTELTFKIAKRKLDDLFAPDVTVESGKSVSAVTIVDDYGIVKPAEYFFDKSIQFTEDGKLEVEAKPSGNYTGKIDVPVRVMGRESIVKISNASISLSYYDLVAKKLVKGTSVPYVGEDAIAENFIKNQLVKSDDTAGDGIKVNNGKVDNKNVYVSLPDDMLCVGKHNVVIYGAGYDEESGLYYTGSVTKTYTIKPDNKPVISVYYTESDDGFIYNLNPAGATPSADDLSLSVYVTSSVGYLLDTPGEDGEDLYAPVYEDVELSDTVDYDLTYANNKNVVYTKSGEVDSKAQLKLKFKGNYAGAKISKTTLVNDEAVAKSPVFTFKIVPAELDSDCEIITIDKVAKNVSVVKSAPYITLGHCLVAANQYNVRYYADEACEYELVKSNLEETLVDEDLQRIYVEVTAKDKKNVAGSVKGSFEVKITSESSVDLSKFKVTLAKSATKEFTGDPISLDDEDYKIGSLESNEVELTYVNNIYKGKAIVIAKPTSNDYYGAKVFNFTINQHKIKK